MLEELVAGGAPMSPAIARKVAQFFHKLSPSSGNLSQITDREREVLHHIAQGASDKQIGSKLRISPNTVRNHVSKIYEKLRVHSRVEATAKYMGRP
jgi:DNA-binding NarL/FixJ family response regulator